MKAEQYSFDLRMVETYNVSWGSYSDHVTAMLQELTASNEFADVTLVCADMVIIQAHKLVLSACSKFFQFILKEACHSDSKPIIFLKGIHSTELGHLLQFMYRGETSFPEDTTNSFLNIANELQIKAFSEDPGGNIPSKEMDSVAENAPTAPPALPNVEHLSTLEQNSSYPTINDEEDLSPFAKEFNIELTKDELQDLKYNEEKPIKAIKFNLSNSQKEGEKNHKELKIEERPPVKVDAELMKRLKVKNYCDLCGFKSSIDSRKHIRIHKITKHKYKLCSNCEYIAPDKDKLNEHMKEAHQESSKSSTFIFSKDNSKVKCDKCDFTTKNQRLLSHHTTMKHEEHRRLKQLKDKFTIIEKESSRIYQCKTCEYENPHATNMKRHIETIHLDLTYPCDQCGYMGTRMQSLMHHINTVHEKQLSRSCKQCDEKFIHYEALRAHVDTVHLGISYNCKQCKSTFTRPGNLNKHVRMFH